MCFWLLQWLGQAFEQWEPAGAGDTRVFLTTRTALASLTAFLLAVLGGPPAIRWLRFRFGERIASGSEKLNELHKSKANTPTMGGLFLIAAVVVSLLLWGNLASRYVHLALFVAIGFGALGAYDDWIKLRTRRNGLTARQKFLVQVFLAGVVAIGLYFEQAHKPHGLDLWWPYGGWYAPLGYGFLLWTGFVLVASSNAVNLTDGLDGLAPGCMVFAGSAFAILAYLAGHRTLAEYLHIPHLSGCGEYAIVMGAVVGASLGFLWYNCHPAQVFMGDTGSLPLGALIGLAAVATRMELLLVIIGGVFVAETLSVIVQVAWFKRTRRRVLLCSPLHNHFLFQGLHETKIVTRFWIAAALLAVSALASLRLR